MVVTLFKPLVFSIAIFIFTADSMLPFGVPIGIPYVLLVLLSLLTQCSWDAIGMAILGSLLTIISYFVSEPAGIPQLALVNCGVALAVIWSACIVLIIHFSSLKELRTMAILDQVTGLHNRHYFFAEAERILKGWARYKTPVTLMLIDLDDFKHVNDTYGHDMGDQVLRHVAETLKQCLRDVDVVARIGGEEFVALLPSTAIDVGDVVAEKIRSAIENRTFSHQQQVVKVTASIGVVAASHPQQSISDLLSAADQLLYHSKKHGKNYVSIEGATVVSRIRNNLINSFDAVPAKQTQVTG